MVKWEKGGVGNRVVLPILPPDSDPKVILPQLFDERIYQPRVAIPALAADVLRFADVGSNEYQLFISYRRDDALELAEALHDAFTHEGFEVFLDRCCSRRMPRRGVCAVSHVCRFSNRVRFFARVVQCNENDKKRTSSVRLTNRNSKFGGTDA
jgi:hypothetical protein